MLERTARCLDPGAHPAAWRPLKRVAKSRRRLHTDFWHHGAGDLELPSWWLPSSRHLFEQDLSPGREKHQSGAATTAAATVVPFLDFLYPASARELLQRRPLADQIARHYGHKPRRYTSQTRAGHVQVPGQAPQRHRSSLAASERTDRRDDALLAAIRIYANHATPETRQQVFVEPPSVPDTVPYEPAADARRSPRSPAERVANANARIAQLLAHDVHVSALQTVRAYKAVPRDLRTSSMALDLSAALADSASKSNAALLAQVIGLTPLSTRTFPLFSRTIAACSDANMLGRAVMAHDKCMKLFKADTRDHVSPRLLGVLLKARHWQLVQHVYSTCCATFPERASRTGLKTWLARVERHVSQQCGRDLPDYVFELLETVEKQRDWLATDYMSDCVQQLAQSVFNLGLDFGKDRTEQVLGILRTVGAISAQVCDAAVRAAERMGTTKAEQHRLAMCFYREYREYHGDRQSVRPSRDLLHRLLVSATRQNDTVAVETITGDWQSHYGRLNATALAVLATWHANRGESKKAETMLASVPEDAGRTVTWETLGHQLYREAQLGRYWAVERRLQSFAKTYNLEPTIVVWNMVLLAYLRADDYDGLMTTFSRIIDTGLTPDAHSFGTVMALTADRGDVELTQRLRNAAASYDIRHNSVLDEELVLAYINGDRLKTAENAAKQFSEGDGRTATPRMWTQLLLAYASRREPQAAVEVARNMSAYGIKFDQDAYAGLMRVFIQDKRPREARELMARMTDEDKLEALPAHHAMLIQAHALESSFETGLRIYARLIAGGTKPGLSVRLAVLQLHALAAKQRQRDDRLVHPAVRLDIVEELLEDMLDEDESQYLVQGDARLVQSAATQDRAYYFQILMDVYGPTQAFRAIATLLERFETLRGRSGRQDQASPSLQILGKIMLLRYTQRAFDEVERYWQLAKQKAVDLSRTAHASRAKVAPSKRSLLGRPLFIYMRALQAQGRSDEILATFQDLTKLGFTLDYLAWNKFVQVLVANKDLAQASALCEQHLMQTFRGWNYAERRPDFKLASGRKGPGLKYLGKRMTFVEPGALTVTHKTMLELGRAVLRLQREASDDGAARETLEAIRRHAPRTMQAALKTPGLLVPGGWFHSLERQRQRGNNVVPQRSDG